MPPEATWQNVNSARCDSQKSGVYLHFAPRSKHRICFRLHAVEVNGSVIFTDDDFYNVKTGMYFTTLGNKESDI